MKENFSWDQRAKWIAADIQESAGYGKDHGVILALQINKSNITEYQAS